MKSLLERIDERLAVISDSAMRAELLAERACYMARAGDATGALELVAQIRGSFGDGRAARVSIRLMLAEGIASYFGGVGDDAQGRVFRATELSRALRLQDLNALTAAWLAHIEFYRSDYQRAIKLVNEAALAGAASDSNAQIRIGLVLADAYSHIGRREEAQNWYQFAHTHAISVGDRAAIAALIYNRSVFAMAWYRAQKFASGEGVSADIVGFLQMEIQSSDTYSKVAKVPSLMHLSDLAIAWSKMLNEDYSSALPILQRVESQVEENERRRAKTSVVGDISLCLAELGRLDEARALIEAVNVGDFDSLDPDDQVVGLGSCLRVCEALGDQQLLKKYSEAFLRAKSAYFEDLSALTEALQNLDSAVRRDGPENN